MLIHLGYGDWIVVDSCIDQVTREHPALAYLDALRVDVARQVRLVVATHAHDDHIAGISEMFKRAENARFVSSSALTSDEFAAHLLEDEKLAVQVRKSSYAEYRRVFDLIQERGLASGVSRHRRGYEQRVLFDRESRGGVPAALVRALSPSDEAVTRATAEFGRVAVGKSKLSSRLDPNETSVAVWVEVGNDILMLLGADLLRGPAGCGWGAVVATHKPATPASLYKVAHHGSPNADHPDTWSMLLEPQPLGLLAPFRAGRTRRPASADIARLASATSELYSTARPDQPAPSKTTRKAAASLVQVANAVREPWGRCGHVRARRTSGAVAWTTEIITPAVRLHP